MSRRKGDKGYSKSSGAVKFSDQERDRALLSKMQRARELSNTVQTPYIVKPRRSPGGGEVQGLLRETNIGIMIDRARMSAEKVLTTHKNRSLGSAMKFGFLSLRRATQRAQTEQATFEALIDGCWDALWRYAYHATGDTDDAEDLLSETLLEGFKCFAQFRGETPFVRWMYRVMTTTHIDRVRCASRRKTESLDAKSTNRGDEGSGWDIPDDTANPEVVVVGPMLSEPVQKALAALPEEFRFVVILADMEQMDYADVSRILQIPIGTVRSRLHRGRAQLRKALAHYVEQ